MERNDHRENPQRAERRMDEAPMEGARRGGVEREGLQGTDRVVEREHVDDRGSATAPEGLQADRSPGGGDAMNASRSGGMENRPGDRSDRMPGEELP